MAIGAVYAVIERLEEKKLIRRADPPETPSRDARARRFFAVTPGGTSALEDTAAVRDRLWRGLRLTRRNAR